MTWLVIVPPAGGSGGRSEVHLEDRRQPVEVGEAVARRPDEQRRPRERVQPRLVQAPPRLAPTSGWWSSTMGWASM